MRKGVVDLRPLSQGLRLAYFPVSRLQPISHLYLTSISLALILRLILLFQPHNLHVLTCEKPPNDTDLVSASHRALRAAMRPMLFQVIERRGSRVVLLQYQPQGQRASWMRGSLYARLYQIAIAVLRRSR